MRISIARTFSGRFSSGLTSSGRISPGRISCGLTSPKQTSPKRSLWAQPSLEQTSPKRASPRKSWNRQPETRTPDSLPTLIPPRTGESRLTNRLGRIEFQRGRGSTEVLRGRKGILRKRDVNLGGSGALDRGCANFAVTEFSEVEVAGPPSYVNLAVPCHRPAYSVALRGVSRVGGNGIVDAHPRLGAIAPHVHLWPKPRRVVQRPRVEPLQIRRRDHLAHDCRAALGTELAEDRQSALAYVLESRQGFSLDSQAPLREDDKDRKGRTRLLLAVPTVAHCGQNGFRLALVADATAQATSDDVRHALSSFPTFLGGSIPFTHPHGATAWYPTHRPKPYSPNSAQKMNPRKVSLRMQSVVASGE